MILSSLGRRLKDTSAEHSLHRAYLRTSSRLDRGHASNRGLDRFPRLTRVAQPPVLFQYVARLRCHSADAVAIGGLGTVTCAQDVTSTPMIPPRTILAPVDFSDASRASLQCAARLAARWTATLHVMHAIDPLLAAAASSQQMDLEGDTRAELRVFLEAAAPDGARTAQYHAVSGGAAATICDVADTLDADVIVVGTRGLSGLNRLVMGTTVEHVIRRARRSVLTVPGHHPASDGSAWGPVIAAIEQAGALGAVAAAAGRLAASLDAPLHLVHVVPPLPAIERWRAAADAALHARLDDARRQLTAAAATLPPPAPANLHVATGPVADTLAAEVSRHAGTTAFLVLGRAEPGHGPAPGSVASRVIARATAPVWVHLPGA